MCLIAPAQAATVPATPVTLTAVLAAAQPGDVVQLAAGDGYHLILRDRAFPADKPLIIDARAATAQGVVLQRVAGVTLRGGTLRAACVAGTDCYNAALDVFDSTDVRIQGVLFQGPEAADGFGARIRNSRGVYVTGSTFFSFRKGLTFDHTTEFEASANRLARMRADGVDIARSWRGRVEGNVFEGTRITGAEHPDAVQAWSRPDAPPTSDIAVRGNLIVGDTQGVFFGNKVRDGVDDGGFDRILIEGNQITGGFPQGIDVVGARASTVRNNHAFTLPGADYQTKINVVGGSVTVCGNTTGAGAGRKALADAAC